MSDQEVKEEVKETTEQEEATEEETNANGDEKFELVDEVKEDEEDKDNKAKEDEDEEGDEGDDESKDKKEDKRKTRPWTARKVPNRAVLKMDRMQDQHQRTVMIGHATLEDLMTDAVQEHIHKCQQFFIRFGRGDDMLKGHLELRFASVPEAKEVAAALKECMRGEIIVQHLTEEVLKSDTYRELTRLGENNCRSPGTFDNRTVAVSGIPEDITQEQLKEKFPDCVGILLPTNDDGKNKGYAYVEYEKSEDADKKVSEFVEFGDGILKGKIYKVDPIPPLPKMTKMLEREKLDAPYMSMNEDKNGKERITNLIRHVRHYMNSDDTPSPRKESLKKWIPLLRRRLRSMKARQNRRPNQKMMGGRPNQNNKPGLGNKGMPDRRLMGKGASPMKGMDRKFGGPGAMGPGGGMRNQNNRNRNLIPGRKGRSPSGNRNPPRTMGGGQNRNLGANRNRSYGGGAMWNRNNAPALMSGGGGMGGGNFGGGMGGGFGGGNFGAMGNMAAGMGGGSGYGNSGNFGNSGFGNSMGSGSYGMDNFGGSSFSGRGEFSDMGGNSYGGMDGRYEWQSQGGGPYDHDSLHPRQEASAVNIDVGLSSVLSSSGARGRFDEDFVGDRYGSTFSDRKRRLSDQGGSAGSFKRGNYTSDSYSSNYGSGNRRW